MLALLHLQSTAFMLAPRAPPQIATSALPPRAAVPSANFGIVNEKDLRKAAAATLASITIPGIDSDCSVTVRYDDDSTTETLSAAEKAQPLWIKYLDIELLGSLYGGMGLMSALEPSFWETEKKRHQAMVEELKASFAALPEELRPKSGEYWGSSEESDDGDQAVRSKITFKANGKVSGRGIDGEDGPYTITQGVWGKRDRDKEHEVTVGWIEDYSEGFLVVVEGFYNTKTGKIEARFRSSRGVSGRFMLAPKPSIFS